MAVTVSKAEFKLTGKWGKLKQLMDTGRVKAALAANIENATRLNAQVVAAAIRSRIRGKKYTPNAALTILLKGSSKPLVDEGLLFQAITYELINERSAFVGVKRMSAREGVDAADVAAIIHEGASITVTPKMRNMFALLHKATTGKMDPSKLEGRAAELYEQLRGRGIIYPLGRGTTAIVIPPRPFLRSVFEDKWILSRLKNNWEKAVKGALTGEGKKSATGGYGEVGGGGGT